MNYSSKKFALLFKQIVAVLLLSVLASTSQAKIIGITGTTFNLTATTAHITTPDGDSVLMWGYAPDGGAMQYPGPTLIVNQGDVITINLTNNLPENVSIVFPGIEGVVSTGGADGVITKEAVPGGGTASYTFTATNAGTYFYHSGTNQDLHDEMGLVGALIVRPAGAANQAYGHADSAYSYEYLMFETDMDPSIHHKVEFGQPVNMTDRHPVLWFLNGRNAPDTFSPDNASWLPNQPYGGLVRVTPGHKALLRFVGGGHDLHPFHTHGNDFTLIARDGRLLESAPGAGADLSFKDYTLRTVPGSTYDALWEWTGEKLGWDVFGTDTAHMNLGCNDGNGDLYDDVTKEYCPDHGKAFPVVLPELQDLAFGGFWSGSPFLGAFGALPPGEGGLNLNGGMFYMWHSHTEREIINNDIYPGGMLTMMIVEPPATPIE